MGFKQTIKDRLRSYGILTPAARFQLRSLLQQRVLLYRRFVKPGGLCFDVGAHEGSRVDVFLRLGARVVAIEPQERCVKVLHKRFGRNRNVTIVPYGVDEHEGDREFLLSIYDDTSSMSQDWVERITQRSKYIVRGFDRDNWNRVVMAHVTTLDKLIDHQGIPDFCKIDVEGFELQVLKGLSRPITALSFEYTPEWIEPAVACVERLMKLGNYRFNYSDSETMKLCLREWVAPEVMSTILERTLSLHLRSGDVYARLSESS